MRILYLGASGSAMANATGQTLRSLFLDLPPENLVEAVYEAGGGPRVLTIPDVAAPLDYVLRGGVRMFRRVRGGSDLRAPTGLNAAIRIDGLSAQQRLLRDLRAAADLSPVRVPRSLLSQVREFAPDVIYSLLGNVRMMKLAIALSDKLSVPIVPHFMDDWPSTLYPNGELEGRARKTVQRTLKGVIDRSPVVVCIGEQMAEEYHRAFDRPTYTAAYGVEETEAPDYEMRMEYPRRLVYAGGLHLGRQQVLEWVASHLNGSGWTVVAYAPWRGSPHANIQYMDPIPVEQIPGTLASADALLFVESLEPAVAAYTRLSVSTKTAQYMAANRPVVLIGPSGQASIELLGRNLSSSIKIDEITESAGDGLRRFLKYGLPERMAARPVPRAFTGKAMREALVDAINDAVAIRNECKGIKR